MERRPSRDPWMGQKRKSSEAGGVVRGEAARPTPMRKKSCAKSCWNKAQEGRRAGGVKICDLGKRI
ncbi:hypothetical protein E2562_030890 [Oryza meyeriana var. granulata]|uniref:Uncharacterized protein n=1 Tax=Oryza meyeriana var. granulata TaxID=110450 RepID=A0A6G1F022_9ORYZ|nr:hypothetical protein E2562_030890 [Oryza meyeriana var. granulata]